MLSRLFAKIRYTLPRFSRVLSRLFYIIESGRVQTKSSVNCEQMFLSRISEENLIFVAYKYVQS